MFKKIFKAAKDLIRSPVGQIGIGLLLPGAGNLLAGVKGAGTMANLARGIAPLLQNPAIVQGGLGLLAGDKPENVLRNLALGAATRGAMNVGQGGTFMGGISDFTGIGDGKTGTIADFFKKKEPVGLEQFLENKNSSLAEFNLLPEAKQMEVLQGFGNTGSTFTNILNSPLTPYITQLGGTALLAKLVADQAEDARAFYNPDENPYFAAKGGGIQGFAMGTPKFPRMTGDISGPGTGTSDSIPAMLSDGEHVLTKQEVSQIGGGDNDLGHQRLYAAREGLRKQARANGIGRI
jgi:hypothetical protein